MKKQLLLCAYCKFNVCTLLFYRIQSFAWKLDRKSSTNDLKVNQTTLNYTTFLYYFLYCFHWAFRMKRYFMCFNNREDHNG